MPISDPIRYVDRYTGRTETEQVYGEGFLKWTYGTLPGRACLRAFVRAPWFSRFYGWRMDRPGSRRRIGPFLAAYGLDASEFAEPPEAFPHFNAFFARRLRPSARPVDPDEAHAVFPADGRHLGFPDVSRIDAVFVKGQSFNLPRLLGDDALAERYARGALVLSRLCPIDYHRFHFPVGGIPGEPVRLPGPLYSVSPLALRRRLDYLWENRRVRTIVRSERFGEVILVEIGATCVGSIVSTFRPGQPVEKGAEKGYFRFGGSSVITLFEPGRVELAADLARHTAEGLELYARMGDTLGSLIAAPPAKPAGAPGNGG